MCGIVGYVGRNHASPFLIHALGKLEYRGYDSAGIAVCNDGNLNVLKKKGRIQVLKNALNGLFGFDGTSGIGHTRWATHGEPSDTNAHPHTCESGKISVVHNGIIENYMILKKSLENKGVIFKSQTDTEVIVAMMGFFYNGDIFNTVRKTILSLEGSFALGILCADYPEQVIAVKKESPLVIGFGDNENYIASDISAFVDKTKKICRLDECEIAVLNSDSVNFYNFNGEKIEKNLTNIDWTIGSSEKDGFEHYMLKEIMEQPAAVRATIKPRIKNNEIIMNELDKFDKKYINSIKKICIVACGSAYHVGVAAKYIFETLIKIPVEVDLASEFRYRSPVINTETLMIIISQSGETADSLAVLRESKRHGAKVLAIVNVVGSSIASESDFVFYTWAGIEISVATTKAYSAQLASIYLFAFYIAKIRDSLTNENSYKKYLDSINKLPDLITNILETKEEIYKIAKKYTACDNVFFLGRGLDYAVSLEGSLKFKEVSYIHSEAYAAGELKHGTISLIETGTLVYAIATNKRLFEKTVSNIREVIARGAVCVVITTESKKTDISDFASDIICIPDAPEFMLASLAVVPLQLIAYYTAVMLGRDIDKPRNLAKSVTVE
ncbi:MAG: glutamine--fructose-6-phosphate transaminase (isomerizing) [Candidatus Improbicoccus devescovinae]|nr:MAG: glutamine--fructose-6-phosphate transaminase (isomerizing) [Candidatus Improbicoccus devescovinae]